MTIDTWNANDYSQFLDLRTRPARDLLAAIPDNLQPQVIYDLGCGPGNSTHLLKVRWPQAKIIGFDSSENMLEKAKISYPDIEFIKGDIATFSPQEKIDCLFANASLHLLDHHEKLIPTLFEKINVGGIFGIQMPNNFHSPLHQTSISVLKSNPAWESLLKKLRYGVMKEPFYKLTWYYDLFTTIGADNLQLWETEYYQEMSNHKEIFDWIKGTALRSVISAMKTDEQNSFEETYVNMISKAYSFQANHKILLPFRRIFIVASKK